LLLVSRYLFMYMYVLTNLFALRSPENCMYEQTDRV